MRPGKNTNDYDGLIPLRYNEYDKLKLVNSSNYRLMSNLYR